MPDERGRPTYDDLREENSLGILERERLEREAPDMARQIAKLQDKIEVMEFHINALQTQLASYGIEPVVK